MSRRASHSRPVVLNRDHARPRTAPAPEDSAVTARLTDLIDPATHAVLPEWRRFGLRDRQLTLPTMVGIVVTLIWRQVSSVRDMTRVLAREGVLGHAALRVSQQALSLRLRTLPAVLFLRVLMVLQPILTERAQQRHRPLPKVLRRASRQFAQIWVVDGTTLEAVFKKVGGLRGWSGTVLGGTVEAVLDVCTKLPVALWFDPDPQANDLRFRSRIQDCLRPSTLLLFDSGYTNFAFYDWLSVHGHGWITRAKANLAIDTVDHVWRHTATVRDRQITFGKYRSNPATYEGRLIEVRVKGAWHQYLTNIPPETLIAADIVDLYGRRWQIEDAFRCTKRLLGMSYLWAGAVNAVALQVWATWLVYAVLIDLTDAVAEELDQPLERLSVEMVYRGLYHFGVAHRAGTASDPVTYLADPANTDLGIVKDERTCTKLTDGDIVRLDQPLPPTLSGQHLSCWHPLGTPAIGPWRPMVMPTEPEGSAEPVPVNTAHAAWPMAPRPDSLNL